MTISIFRTIELRCTLWRNPGRPSATVKMGLGSVSLEYSPNRNVVASQDPHPLEAVEQRFDRGDRIALGLLQQHVRERGEDECVAFVARLFEPGVARGSQMQGACIQRRHAALADDGNERIAHVAPRSGGVRRKSAYASPVGSDAPQEGFHPVDLGLHVPPDAPRTRITAVYAFAAAGAGRAFCVARAAARRGWRDANNASCPPASRCLCLRPGRR